MAEVLSINDLLANTYEPKRVNQWIISIDGIDSFTAVSAARPTFTTGEAVIDYINTKRYVATKREYQTFELKLKDPIAPSAMQKVMEWNNLIYQPETGRMGYLSFYQKEITLKLLDPMGVVIEKWTIHNAWITSNNFGNLDYADGNPLEISITIRFDYATLEY